MTEQLPMLPMPRQRTGPGVLTLVGAPSPVTFSAAAEAEAGAAGAAGTVGAVEAADVETPGLNEGSEADGAPLSDSETSEAPEAPETPEAQPRVAVYGDPDFDDPWPSPRRQIAIAVRVLCGLIVVVLLGHRFIPNVMGVGSLIDTFLPWTFVPLAPALVAALASRSRWAVGVATLACGVWAADFGPALVAGGPGGRADLRVLSQNVSSQNPDLAGISRLAQDRDADIVVLQGMNAADIQAADRAVPSGYRHHLAMYEFSVWSKYPIDGSQPVDLATRAGDPAQAAAPTGGAAGNAGLFGGLLRFTVQVDRAHSTTVYAVHLPQPNLSHLGFGVARDNALDALATAIKTESAPNLIVVGDLDLAQTDRGMRDLLNADTGLVSAQSEAGSGFGFTWPASFPMVRLDDVLTRGLTPVRSTVLGAVGPASAHRPIEADLRF